MPRAEAWIAASRAARFVTFVAIRGSLPTAEWRRFCAPHAVLGTGAEGAAVELSMSHPGRRSVSASTPAKKTDAAHQVAGHRILTGGIDPLTPCAGTASTIIVAARSRGGVLAAQPSDCKLMGVRVLDRAITSARSDSCGLTRCTRAAHLRRRIQAGLRAHAREGLFDRGGGDAAAARAVGHGRHRCRHRRRERLSGALSAGARRQGGAPEIVPQHAPHAEGDGKPRWASTNDDRVTRTGRIIRKLRIDELPQPTCCAAT
jgi:hypothetical protein